MLIPQFVTDPTLINLQASYQTNIATFPPGYEGLSFLQNHTLAAMVFRHWDDDQGQLSGYPPCSWGPYWTAIRNPPELRYHYFGPGVGSFYLLGPGGIPIDLATILAPPPVAISTLNASFSWMTIEQIGLLVKRDLHEWLFNAIDKYLTDSGQPNDGGVLLNAASRVQSTWFYEVCRCYFEIMDSKGVLTWDLSTSKCPPPPPPSGILTVTPTTMVGPGSVTLSWSSLNATSASIDHGIGVVPISGSTTVSVSASTTFTLTLLGPGGSTTIVASVIVVPPPPPPPTGTFSGSPSIINSSDDAVLQWTSSNAATAEIDNAVGFVALNGTHKVNPTTTTTYHLTLIGPGGSVTLEAKITVPPLKLATLISIDIPYNKPNWPIFDPAAVSVLPAIRNTESVESAQRRGKHTYVPKKDRSVVGKQRPKKKRSH